MLRVAEAMDPLYPDTVEARWSTTVGLMPVTLNLFKLYTPLEKIQAFSVIARFSLGCSDSNLCSVLPTQRKFYVSCDSATLIANEF